MFDLQVPFFKPLWLRIVVVVVALGWAVFELMSGSIGFAMIFAAMGLFAAWQFFAVWNPKEESDDG